MRKAHAPLLCLAVAMILAACSGGEPSMSAEPSPNLPDDVRKGEVAGDAAPEGAGNASSEGGSPSEAAGEDSSISDTVIYHGFVDEGNGEQSGVFVHMSVRGDGSIDCTINEYLYDPANVMFEMYGATPAVQSEGYIQFHRVDMRNAQFDASGVAHLTADGAIEISYSGDAMTYHAYGDDFDFTFEGSRISTEDYVALMRF